MLRRSSIAFLVVCLWGAASAMADIVVDNLADYPISSFTSGIDIGGATNLKRAIGFTAQKSFIFDRATFAIWRNPAVTSSFLTLDIHEDIGGEPTDGALKFNQTISITSASPSAAVFSSGSVALNAGSTYWFVLSGNTGLNDNLQWGKVPAVDNPYDVDETYIVFNDPAFRYFHADFGWNTDVDGILSNQRGMRIEVSNVPEPSTWVLMGLGIGVVTWRRRRKLKAKDASQHS